MLVRLNLAFSAMFILTAAVPVLASEEVNVYSYRQPELVDPLFDAFTEETGIRVNSVFLSKGLVERLKSEGDRSPADLVLTTDISRLTQLVDEGVTQAVENATLEQQIPALYRDSGGHWFGLTSRARVIYASKDRVADGELTTYEDLATDAWHERICMRSGTNAYNIALTAAVISHHGEDCATQWLESVKGNLARKPQGNDRAQVKAIWAGECDISIGNTYYMGLMLKDPEQQAWADSVRIIFPTFEDGGTHVNISGMAMTRAAPNRDNALKLMEFLSSVPGQQLYSELNNEYPVDPDVPASDLVTSWGSFNADNLDLTDLAKRRPDALRLTESVDFDG